MEQFACVENQKLVDIVTLTRALVCLSFSHGTKDKRIISTKLHSKEDNRGGTCSQGVLVGRQPSGCEE
jgi:hypothetical protein